MQTACVLKIAKEGIQDTKVDGFFPNAATGSLRPDFRF